MIRVVTWNMQGGGGADTVKNSILESFFNNGYNVICLQEVTNPLGSFRTRTLGHHDVVIASPPPPVRGRVHPRDNYVCYYRRWGFNPRCSLAIYTRGTSLDYGVITLPPALGGGGQRPMLWVRVAPNYYVASIHLSQAAHGTMWNRFDHFRSALAPLMPGVTRVIAGDYNLSPEDLTDGHPGEIAHFTFTPVGVKTHQRGGRLDYVYSNALVTNLFPSPEFHSDHCYLTFIVH
ncbi:endonuclease/exonuclease/phosphatase family protein [Bacteroides salyersiae]|uniref:Endonuclease/exonuclease/phosphatase domain-containing protein n=1 Tax=Bacteroides salyersiae TaxID=291644 RepID=A0A7J4XI30_9BACE|nr:endonuclease/exonuclease/phosphatase family protein [Bacteroides salyersiae]KAA3691828.1 hypothetical protein F3F90_11410 [Bacteroides salyersiae]KAA3695483.1 hypothetical protein F3F89_15615 [Bacteroides salyersiae]KAA3695957.1 hypothetical protein F3F88_16075 [Bacteroides salyersiae]KAA3704976.1 hypothetical protein F3F83_14860 [Bacteroides salyersiae]KAA3711258.1 hypothetical protein F3G06_16680 [Bacteroides salyersiae]